LKNALTYFFPQDERIRPLVVGVDKSIYVFGGYTDRNKQVANFVSPVALPRKGVFITKYIFDKKVGDFGTNS
jgi:hypothetical protein